VIPDRAQLVSPTERSSWRRCSGVRGVPLYDFSLPAKNRALPHIGPDAVKIRSPDGCTLQFVVRGTIRARYTRETGE